ncbi:MAG TPA: monofunctional biosynthetic peptidoglycan transglycosylase [Rhizomicrobium sp.]|nr:monofunctional biosynthetic peptidoglycan transglycosylase [Rhizomicrobium sp.]
MDWGAWGRRLAESADRFWNGSGARTPWMRRVLAVIVFFLVPGPILYLLIFRFLPIPFTPEMAINLVTLNATHYAWVGENISPSLARAVIASEDQQFCFHHGFDWKEIDHAIKSHERHPKRKLRGASTISQQTARTLFLVSWRSWVRKGVEAYLTMLTEFFWPKERILEAYLNTVDFGHGNYGAEAASEAYFGVPASALSPLQAARLAVILPDPDVWKASRPGPYVAGRSRTILARMGEVRRDGLDWCVKTLSH